MYQPFLDSRSSFRVGKLWANAPFMAPVYRKKIIHSGRALEGTVRAGGQGGGGAGWCVCRALPSVHAKRT